MSGSNTLKRAQTDSSRPARHVNPFGLHYRIPARTRLKYFEASSGWPDTTEVRVWVGSARDPTWASFARAQPSPFAISPST